MKLKLQDCASIADIVSGLAIVVTLIFLIFGVRESTIITRAGAYDRNIDSLIDVKAMLAADPQLAENYMAVDRGEWAELSPQEQFRIRVVFEMFFGVYEKTYFANKYGYIRESEWGRFRRQVCIHYGRVSRNSGMADAMRIVMTDDFFAYVTNTCNASGEIVTP
ncbi:MAG: hypothetical protein WD076_03055 [Parvularculaceae bacterium]